MSASHGDATIFHRLVTRNWEANGIPPLSLKCSVREVPFLQTVRPCVGQLSYAISRWASSPWFLVGYCHKWQVSWIPKLWLILKGTACRPQVKTSRRLALISICYSTTHLWYVTIPHLRQFFDPNWWVSFLGVCLKIWYPPKSIGYIITINIGHWWKPIFRQAPIGFMTILSMLFLLIACPLQAISGFRRWRSFPFKVTTRSFAVSRVFRIAVWS